MGEDDRHNAGGVNLQRNILTGTAVLAVSDDAFGILHAILPAFARFFGISQNFAQFFGGTSLLIMVGVVLDTLQQVESHLMMHHYDGLMKEGKIKR